MNRALKLVGGLNGDLDGDVVFLVVVVDDLLVDRGFCLVVIIDELLDTAILQKAILLVVAVVGEGDLDARVEKSELAKAVRQC